MEDVSDIAFRLLCKKYGAGITYTEMNHAGSVVRGNLKRSVTCEEERPVGIQVAGRDIDEIIETAKTVEKNADIIDINLGCPGTNVISRGYGSALLKEPELIGKIIRALVEVVDLPVTAKMRAGYTKEADALLISKIIQENGASAAAIHPRTTSQRYTGKANWDIIKDVKSSLKIPVIGNGDIKTPEDAKRMFEETKCDAIMIGRAAIGDPLIFKRTILYIEEGILIESTQEEKTKAFEEYIRLARKHDLLYKTRLIRQAQMFTRSMKNSTQFRLALNQAKDKEEIVMRTVEFLST